MNIIRQEAKNLHCSIFLKKIILGGTSIDNAKLTAEIFLKSS